MSVAPPKNSDRPFGRRICETDRAQTVAVDNGALRQDGREAGISRACENRLDRVHLEDDVRLEASVAEEAIDELSCAEFGGQQHQREFCKLSHLYRPPAGQRMF